MSASTFHVIGLYRTRGGAKAAIDELVRAQFDLNRLSLLLTEPTRARWLSPVGSEVARRPARDPVTRGAFAAVATELAPAGVLCSGGPLLLVAGPLGAVVANRHRTSRRPLDGLLGIGLTAQQARRIADQLARGFIVVAVETGCPDEVERAQAAFQGTRDIAGPEGPSAR